MTTDGDLQNKLRALYDGWAAKRAALAAKLYDQAQAFEKDRLAQFKALDEAYYAERQALIASKEALNEKGASTTSNQPA